MIRDRPQGRTKAWPRDFTALDTTLRRDPNTYRVRRLGPFEYVKPVTARSRILTTDLADRLFAAASVRCGPAGAAAAG
ncbi:MAG TPA: hypothetical protein VMS16_13060 [Mycobacterium sp.]|jgi:hypothetical protein|nr:hypothetical protein [Mycobacterium sp.]